MNTGLGPLGSPCLPRPHFQPFCSQPPHRPNLGICFGSLFVSARGRRPEDPVRQGGQREMLPLGFWPGLRTALAGSPVGVAESDLLCVMFNMSPHYGRVVHFRLLPTPCCHDAVAFGYRRVNFPPDGDFHPTMCTPSQAHERARPRAQPSPPAPKRWILATLLLLSTPLRPRTSALR